MVPLTDKKIILVDQIGVKHHDGYLKLTDFTLKKGLCYHAVMLRLIRLLKEHESATLKIIADYWGVLASEVTPELVEAEINDLLRHGEGLKEIVDALPADALSAWTSLNGQGGKQSWAVFSRKFGDVRAMGASRIAREKPQLNPVNAAETLWYRGMLGRTFIDQKPEPQEIAYLPDEFRSYNPVDNGQVCFDLDIVDEKEVTSLSMGPLETLNDLTTILAAVRSMKMDEVECFLFHEKDSRWLLEILETCGLLSRDRVLQADKVRSWFDQTPAEMLALLVDAWYASPDFNELRLIPEIVCEGSWKNDPKAARIFVWNTLNSFTEAGWIKVKHLIAAIHQKFPDFQRPAGNYDLWLIRDAKTSEYLKGFESWDCVENRLLLLIITRIMPALGLLDVGIHKTTRELVFRWSAWGKGYLQGEVSEFTLQPPRNTIRSQGDIHISSCAPFASRYQLSRFCEWVSLRDKQFFYRLNLQGLRSAQNSGMEIKHIPTVLQQLFGKAVPPTLIKAILHYEKNGCLLTGERVSVLKLSDSHLLETLSDSPAARFLGEKLNPATIIIPSGKEKELEKSLLESGYFSEFHLDV